jgi:serine/threonine-protein kinase
MIGRTISHYKILEKLGGGGMGVVYKAQDLKLDRFVALKFLPPDLTRDPEARERFIHEAKAASALQHNNICNIHDIDETDDGQIFIVMDCYDGETLEMQIARRQLRTEDATDIAAQIALGLQKAHEKGIVHRDLKPANVIITQDGVVKILDFGLAKLAGQERLTKVGSTVGTAAYMSPEQVRTEEVDHRTDIWSLGVVLYEMITQKRPFRGEHPAALMYSITNEDPVDLTQLRTYVPKNLFTLCWCCLQKDRENRPSSMEAVLAILRAGPGPMAPPHRPMRFQSRYWKQLAIFGLPILCMLTFMLVFPSVPRSVGKWIGISAEPEVIHIAVLPFTNIGNDPSIQFSCDGLTETLTSSLTVLLRSDLSSWVVSSSDVRNPRFAVAGVDDARRMFGVTYVVTGSLQGAYRRMTLNLVNAANGRQIAGSVIPFASVNDPGLQDAAVAALARMLHRTLEPDVRRSLAVGATSDAVANGLYLEGLGCLKRSQNADNIDTAITKFTRAIQRDASFALAHAHLGSAYIIKFIVTRDPQWLEKARLSCVCALEITDQLPSAYVTLGDVHRLSGQTEEAMADLQRALAIDSTNVDAHIGVAKTFASLNKVQEAERTFLKAISLRPEYWFSHNALGAFYLRLRRFEEAAAQFRLCIEVAPENYMVYNNLGGVYLQMDRPKEASQMLELSVKIKPDYGNYSNLGTIYWRMKRYADAAGKFEQALRCDSNHYEVWGNLAEAYQMIPDNTLKMRNAAKRAIELAERERKVNPFNAESIADLATYYTVIKDKMSALPLLRTALDLGGRSPNVCATVAQAYEDIGERVLALQTLATAFRLGYSPSELERNPQMKQLLIDPRYQELLKRNRN